MAGANSGTAIALLGYTYVHEEKLGDEILCGVTCETGMISVGFIYCASKVILE